MAVVKSKQIDPWKLKKWYPIIAPSYMRGAFIGETPADSPEKVINKQVEISIAAVTGEIKRQNTNVTFKVVGFENNNAVTEIIKIEVSPAYIKRNVRKEKTRVDDSFALKTADGKDVRIKIFLVSKDKINNSKQTLLRKLAKSELREYVSKVPYEQIIQDVLSFKLQKILMTILRKVCPLKTCEMRAVELLKQITTAEKAASA